MDLAMPDGNWSDRDKAWQDLVDSLFAWLHDALARGEPLDFAQLRRNLEMWQAFVEEGPLGGRDSQHRQWNYARRLLWCAEQAMQKSELDGSVIDRVCLALASTPAFLQGYAGWVWDCLRLLVPSSQGAASMRRSLDVPVAVAEEVQDTGYLCTLQLEVLEPGVGHVFPHPAYTLMTALDAAFDAAMQHAWTAARRLVPQESSARPCDGRWRLLQRDSDIVRAVSGPSAGGAAALGWYHALRGTVPDEGLIVLTGVEPDGVLTGVGGIRAKVMAIAADERFDTIVVATAENQCEAEDALRKARKFGPIRVSKVENLDASNA